MKNQRGFAAPIVALLILILVIAAGFVFTQRNSDNVDEAGQTTVENNITTVNATDSTGALSYSYPSSWTIPEYVWDDCCSGPPKAEPDWKEVSQPITLKPANEHENVKVSFTFNPTGTEATSYEPFKSIDEMWADRTIDQFNIHERISINGADVLHTVTDFVGPAEVEAYKDHYYTFFKNGTVATVYFREHYRHNWNNEGTNGQTNYKASEHLDDFEAIVKSIEIA